MIGWTAEHMELAGLIAYGTAEIVSAGRTPRAPGKKRSRRDRLAALGQVSRSVPGDLCSLRWVLRKDSLMNGGYPLRPVASARTRPVAGIAAQPGGCQRPQPAPAHGSRPASVRRSAACDSGPPICCLRQLALEVSHRAQYRLCPVVVGLRQTRQRLRYKRQDLSWHYAAVVNGIQASA